MRCFRSQTSRISYRGGSPSTLGRIQAATLRTDTHPAGGISVDCLTNGPIQSALPSVPQTPSEAWLPCGLPPPPMLMAPSSVPIDHAVLGLPIPKEILRIRTPLPTETARGLKKRHQVRPKLIDGAILACADSKEGDKKDPVSERKLNLGKTIDILKERLPTLLQSPLPSEILSPSISLQLFPSTHPHLPTVRGRMAYVAALWTSPVVWGRIPGIKTHLEILSIKMIKDGIPLEKVDDANCDLGGEQMIVKWRASSSPNGNGNGNGNGETGISPSSSTSPTSTTPTPPKEAVKDDALAAIASSLPKISMNDDFCGLFIFEFDEKGRIKTHIIEDVEEDREEGRKHHSKVITLTEWLLKKARGSLEDKQPVPGLAFSHIWHGADRRAKGFLRY